jgi:L-ascorbate metabolism protein UlaG (beta-lactamase superfamily)
MAKLYYQGHASFRIISDENYVIYVDPFAGDGYEIPADLILITHRHHDHSNYLMVEKKCFCTILTDGVGITNEHYNTYKVGNIVVQSVEAYNKFHDKKKSVGWIITVDGIKIYASGDTSITNQMGSLAEQKIDYAFFAIDGIYNMDFDEATAAANLVGAKHNIPIHLKPDHLFDLDRAEMWDGPNKLIIKPAEEIELKKS